MRKILTCAAQILAPLFAIVIAHESRSPALIQFTLHTNVGLCHRHLMQKCPVGTRSKPSDDSNRMAVYVLHKTDLRVAFESITLIDAQLVYP